MGVGRFYGVGAVGLQGGGFDPVDGLVIGCDGDGEADDGDRLEGREFGSAGVRKCWSLGVLTCWSAGVRKFGRH